MSALLSSSCVASPAWKVRHSGRYPRGFPGSILLWREGASGLPR